MIDPLLFQLIVSQAKGRGCITGSGDQSQAGAATYLLSLPTGTTLMGLPRVKLNYTATAPDFELNARLWDVTQDGSRTLITRGVYRGASLRGTIVYELFGTAWRIKAGHRLQLELLQDDSTFLRPDNVPSTVTIERARLELPVR